MKYLKTISAIFLTGMLLFSCSKDDSNNATISTNEDVPFKVKVQPNASNQITIKGINALLGVIYTYDFDIDWGDGSAIETITTNSVTHTYANDNEYTISMTGLMPNIQIQDQQVVDVLQWGENEWILLNGMFLNNHNITTFSATDAPDLSKAISLNGMFFNCRNFNEDISSWDVGNITNMRGMFEQADAFNKDISSWNVINVTDMGFMFYDATAFNQDLSSWDVRNVTDHGSFGANSGLSTANFPSFN